MAQMKKRKKGIIILSLLIVLLITLGGLGAYGYNEILDTDSIYEGIYIDEFDISLMTKEDALEFLQDKKEKEIDEKNMPLIYEGLDYSISLRELGFNYDYSKAVEEAYIIGREGNIVERLKEIYKIKKEGAKINLESDYDKTKAAGIVSTIAEEINLEMVDAVFDFNNGNIQVSEEVIGKDLKEEELISLINDNVYTLDSIDIPVEEIMPNRTKDVLGRVNGVIGEFSTSFGSSTPGRKENIRISSNAIKGNLVMPGEAFSFNQTTGPRTRAAGYKEATVILDGEFEPGVGGGICQTSTTFYNALLRADLTIIERSHHSVPISYVPLGQDAAVAGNYLDVKFRNDFEFPVYIDTKVVNDNVYMYIYGDKNTKNYNVKLDSQTVETIRAKEETVNDSSLSAGTRELVQSARNGYKVHTFKSKIRDGKVLSRDLITKDFYRPRNSIYRVGTKKVKEAKKPVKSEEPEKEIEEVVEAEEVVEVEDEE